jgi:hypothetical protein
MAKSTILDTIEYVISLQNKKRSPASYPLDLLQKSIFAPLLPPAPNPQRGPQVPQREPHAPPILGGT